MPLLRRKHRHGRDSDGVALMAGHYPPSLCQLDPPSGTDMAIEAELQAEMFATTGVNVSPMVARALAGLPETGPKGSRLGAWALGGDATESMFVELADAGNRARELPVDPRRFTRTHALVSYMRAARWNGWHILIGTPGRPPTMVTFLPMAEEVEVLLTDMIRTVDAIGPFDVLTAVRGSRSRPAVWRTDESVIQVLPTVESGSLIVV